MEERRRQERRRTYPGCRLVSNDRSSAVDGVVRDLSAPGGPHRPRQTPAAVPEEFNLKIHKTGTDRRARLVWQEELQAGVAFVLSEGVVVSLETIRIRREVAELRTERDMLCRRLAELTEPL